MSALCALATDIKIHHSVFALPFALLAAVMAAIATGPVDWSRFAWQLLLVLMAMVCARTVAMLANRILDAPLDATNPRTASRAIPSGRATSSQATICLAIAAACFIGCCCGFALAFANLWPLILSVPVLVWISAYGITKRFTALCHLYLGSSLALSVPAAALAIEPSALALPALWLLAGMVLCWVAGFDIIYALQDVEVDRRDGLHSVPSQLGTRGALWVSRLLHTVAIVLLGLAWQVDSRLGTLFALAIGIVALVLLVEHLTVRRWGTSRLAVTFFTLNGVVSVILGVAGVIDILAR